MTLRSCRPARPHVGTILTAFNLIDKLVNYEHRDTIGDAAYTIQYPRHTHATVSAAVHHTASMDVRSRLMSCLRTSLIASSCHGWNARACQRTMRANLVLIVNFNSRAERVCRWGNALPGCQFIYFIYFTPHSQVCLLIPPLFLITERRGKLVMY